MSKKPVPKKEELERKKRLAYTLYVDNGFAQKLIAEITGISEVSISKWKNDGNWDAAREDARMGTEQQRRRLMKQYNELLSKIETRKSPENVPDSKEADILNKLADAVKKLATEMSFAHKSEAGKLFISYVQETYGQARAVEVVELWHEFLMATS